METPKTTVGDTTEEIMAIFWKDQKEPKIDLSTAQYNRVYSHVLDVLNRRGLRLGN